jgi:hypothetical protein
LTAWAEVTKGGSTLLRYEDLCGRISLQLTYVFVEDGLALAKPCLCVCFIDQVVNVELLQGGQLSNHARGQSARCSTSASGGIFLNHSRSVLTHAFPITKVASFPQPDTSGSVWRQRAAMEGCSVLTFLASLN